MDEVAVDAKRILLRYGAPIDILDDVSEVERIELARLVAKTNLPDRERHLRQELADRGYMEPPPIRTRKKRSRVRAPTSVTDAPTSTASSAAGGTSTKTTSPASNPAASSTKTKSTKKPESHAVETAEAEAGEEAKKSV